MMPLMGGLEATAIIRDPLSSVRNHLIPIIAMTACAFKSDRAKCLAAGMSDYLGKPFEIEELQNVLHHWLSPAVDLPLNTLGDQSAAIFDADTLVKRSLNDLKVAHEVALILLNAKEEYLHAIHRALTSADMQELRHKAHKLKGAASNVSLSLLSNTAGKLEAIAAAGNLDDAEELLPLLDRQFDQAADALRNFLGKPERVSRTLLV